MVRHIILLLFLALFWSGSFMAIKIGVGSIPPLSLTAGRVLLAAVVLAGIACLQGVRMPAEAKFWGFCFLIGILGNGLPFTLMNWGEEKVDSSQAAILMAVMPLATIVLAHFFSVSDRITPAKASGVFFGFIGVIILVEPEAMKGLGGDFWRQLAIFGSAMCYALTVVIIRNMPPFPLMARSAGVLIASALVMVPVALVVDASWTIKPSAEGLLAMVYLGIFPTALSTVILFYLVKQRGANFVAYANYLIPAFAVLWGAIFLDESLSGQAGLATAVILSGMVVTQIRRFS